MRGREALGMDLGLANFVILFDKTFYLLVQVSTSVSSTSVYFIGNNTGNNTPFDSASKFFTKMGRQDEISVLLRELDFSEARMEKRRDQQRGKKETPETLKLVPRSQLFSKA